MKESIVMLTLNRAWLVDMGERVVMTFAAAFLASLVVPQLGGAHVSALNSGAVAGAAAVATLLKTVVASKVGDGSSASLVPSVGAPVFVTAPVSALPGPVLITDTFRPASVTPIVPPTPPNTSPA